MWDEIQAGFTEASDLIAQAQGADLTTGNTLIPGHTDPVTGAYGGPQVIWLPLPAGGYRKKTVLPLRIPKARLTTPPKQNTKITRTDITPQVAYNIDHVETQDPVFWVIMLVNIAG